MALTVLAQHLSSDPARGVVAGDLSTDERGIKFAFGADAVVVLMSNACRQQPGEDKRNPSRGIPRDMLLGKGVSAAAIRSVYLRKLTEVSAITAVPSCDAVIVGDAVTITATAETSEGPVSASFTLGAE